MYRYIIILLLVLSSLKTNNNKIKQPIYFNDIISINLDTISVTPINYFIRDRLVKLIYTEARGELLIGKIAVLNVIQNRVKKNNSSIIEVIDEKGQFDGRWVKTFETNNITSCKSCYDAVDIVLKGYSILPNTVTYYHNPLTATDNKWVKYIEKFKYKQIGRHVFCHHPKLITKNKFK